MTRPIELILSRLEKVSGNKGGSRYRALCPGHADRSPSLSICEGDDGRVLLHCFSGCSAEAIVFSIKLTMTDLFCVDNSTKRPPLVSGVSRRELRAAIEFEKTILFIAKADETKGRCISTNDSQRAQLALQRIAKSKGLL
jgi:CHC2 zinc finger